MAREKVAYIIKKFYPYFWSKFGFPVEDETESECIELVVNLRKAVWVHRIITSWHWYPFLEKHVIPMISSPEIYVSYVFFMVSTTIQNLPNIHESFMTTCSLVTAVAAYVYDKGYLEFLDYSPTILTVFFENVYVDESGAFPVWDHLKEYFINNNYSKAYAIVEKRMEGNPFADAIYDVDFVREIKFNIKSKIPVSKHAAVYCQTREVMERFISRKSLKVISTRSVSTQTKQSLQEDVNEQSTSEKDAEDILKRAPLPHSEKSPLPEVNNWEILDSEGSAVRGKKIEVIVSNRSASFQTEQPLQNRRKSSDSESQQGIFVAGTENKNLKISSSQSVKLDMGKQVVSEGKETINRREDTEFIDAKLSSSWELEKMLQTDVKKPKKSEIEQTVNVDEATLMNSSQLEQSLEGLKMPRMSENEQRISAEDNEAFSSKIWPSQSAEKSLQNTEKPRMPASRQSISAKDAEAVNPELISSYSENPPSRDVEEARNFESGQSADGEEVINLKHLSLSQLERMDMPRISEIISEEENEAVDLTTSSRSKEQAFQNMEKSRISNSGGSISMAEDTESIGLKWNPPQVEQSFQEGWGSISIMQNTGENNWKQIALFQSQEKRLQDAIEKLKVSDNEQSPLANFLSEDNTSQFRGGNQMGDNYSDAIQHDEARASRENSESRVPRKKKKNKSKSKKPKQTDSETTLHVPSKKDALYVLVFLLQKLNNSLETVYALLDISRNN